MQPARTQTVIECESPKAANSGWIYNINYNGQQRELLETAGPYYDGNKYEHDLRNSTSEYETGDTIYISGKENNFTLLLTINKNIVNTNINEGSGRINAKAEYLAGGKYVEGKHVGAIKVSEDKLYKCLIVSK